MIKLRTLGLLLALALVPTLGGCAYTCIENALFETTCPADDWTVKGMIERNLAVHRIPDTGDWSHWRSYDDDRYRLELRPVCRDTTYWVGGDVMPIRARVIAGTDTTIVTWTRRSDDRQRIREHYREQKGNLHHPGRYWLRYGQPLERGPYSFVSADFTIRRPVPDAVVVEYELLLTDRSTGRIVARWALRDRVPIPRHRRWAIKDLLEDEIAVGDQGPAGG